MAKKMKAGKKPSRTMKGAVRDMKLPQIGRR